MILRSRASLRQLLTVPYVALVLLAAVVIGLLSYKAGSDAVNTLSDYVLNETVSRITQAVDKHISGAEAVLETAFPSDVPAPGSIKAELEVLRARLWQATSAHRDPHNYAYYGDRNGHFVGVWRLSASEAELRLRTDVDEPRTFYRYLGMHGELQTPVREQRLYDPRERPWFKAAQAANGANAQIWTGIYADFSSKQLVGTRARRVNNAAGEFEGVVATDLFLQSLNDFLKNLKLSANGFAFIVEPNGNLVATSRGPHVREGAGGNSVRLNAGTSDDAMIAATYNTVKTLAALSDAKGSASTTSFDGPDGGVIQAGYARLQDKAGLEWIIVVAVPRADFMQDVTANARRTAILALLACLLIGGIGFMVLNIIAKDLRRLAVAAKAMGDGVVDSKIPTERTDEIGELAKSFATMQKQIFTDRLTGIANREAIVRRIEDRIIRQRRRGDNHPFGVLFVDLNGFKQINDRFGHDVGDQVLVEIAQRLAKKLRDTDMAARFGGDEFVVLLENVANRTDAGSARDKLERALAEPLQSLAAVAPEAAAFGAGAAIGIALCPEEGYDIETLLKRADKDMYERKQARAARAGGAQAT
jgi:diguanylate cyclase (GGDEF)-like protein